MIKNILKPNQQIRGAIIFLNTLGLIVEELDIINWNSKVKVFNIKGVEVGDISFCNNEVKIDALTVFGKLDASYEYANAKGLEDYDTSLEEGIALYVGWSHNIKFSITKDRETVVKGIFSIDCNLDTEFGNKCTCHPSFEFYNNGKNIINLEFMLHGRQFYLEIKNDDLIEKIEIMPFDDLNGYIKHVITKGEYERNKGYPYRRYAGIFNGSTTGEYQNCLHVYYDEEEYGNSINFRNEFIAKVEYKNSPNALIQKGELMQKIDEDMYKTIEKLRRILTISDISLLDNLIYTCFGSFSDDEIKALFNTTKKNNPFQNKEGSLTDAYLGTREKTIFKLERKKVD